ncbi:TonB-dependent receptor [Billgrantia sp. Q4P2]|uniref:TonB-dependent receptor n=1 Tax=Billgrantia sp. Q4P2 TaxID=3463857 RepID=UPI004057C8A8
MISATHFAQQMVDAPSAVSVVTAEEIRRFGYRTIAEILDSMRGIHITRDRDYSYLGGRGYGAPGEYAGRIMILIDGYSAADNYYNQIFIAEDGYLDTALIERVEYAPGPGSAIYGNNAFLGVINIVTRKGRDFEGFDTELTVGSHNEREGRVTWGNRFANGTEWLISASRITSDGVRHYHDGETIANADLLGERLFLKGNYRGWSLEAATADKWRNSAYPALDIEYRSRDRNRFVNLGYDADLGLNWRTATRLYYGDFLFNGKGQIPSHDILENAWTNGRWYGVDSKLIYLGHEGHQLLFGSEYRVDDQQDFHSRAYTASSGELWHMRDALHNGDTFSLYGEDRIALSPALSASIGGRYDRRRYRSFDTTYDAFNPRLALNYSPWHDLTFKLSHGQASRFIPIHEVWNEVDQPSRVRTTELVAEHTTDNRRLLASLYRYRVDRLPENFFGVESQTIRGAELESEWQWPGARTLRLSYAWQHAEDDQGWEMPNVPRHIGKLQVTTPLLGERLRASLALRYIGERQDLWNEPLSGYTLTDLTLTSSEPMPGMTLTLGVRNLFDTRYRHVSFFGDEDGLLPQDGRTVWLRLGYRFP